MTHDLEQFAAMLARVCVRQLGKYGLTGPRFDVVDIDPEVTAALAVKVQAGVQRGFIRIADQATKIVEVYGWFIRDVDASSIVTARLVLVPIGAVEGEIDDNAGGGLTGAGGR